LDLVNLGFKIMVVTEKYCAYIYGSA